MTTTNGTTKRVFPFFQLPRELRDIVYELSYGDKKIKSKGKRFILRAKVEHGMHTNLLLVSKQFRREYVERHKQRGRMVIDATPAQYSPFPEIDVLMHTERLRTTQVLRGLNEVKYIEVNLATVLQTQGFNYAQRLKPLVDPLCLRLAAQGSIHAVIKLFIFLHPSQFNTSPLAPRSLQDLWSAMGGQGRFDFQLRRITNMLHVDRIEFHCQQSRMLPKSVPAEVVVRSFNYVGCWTRDGDY